MSYTSSATCCSLEAPMEHALSQHASLDSVAEGDKGPWWTLVLIALALLTLAVTGPLGCSDDEAEDPGVLTIGWRVSPLGCDESGVEAVDVRLDGLDGQPSITRTLACASGRVILDDLDPGTYAFRLVGRDKAGQATFQSDETRVSVRPGRVTTMNAVRLTARPGALTVTWFFDNGHLCASNGVQYVLVGVYDLDAYAIAETLVDCNQGTGHVEGLQSGSFLVELIGLAPDMTGLYRGIEQIELERGDEIKLDVSLDTCGEGC